MSQEKLKGVMFNAYPDSIGLKLRDTVDLLSKPEFKNVFSLFYILPTFFNSDLDRGFSIIDYNLNRDLVDEGDLIKLDELGIKLKFDIVLNHLSVNSPQFKDIVLKGEDSEYLEFFIDWNEFWRGHGNVNDEGLIIPHKEYLDKLFMRKSGMPVLKVLFPDGSEKYYWNTFYQKVFYEVITPEDLEKFEIKGDLNSLSESINQCLSQNKPISDLKLTDEIFNKVQKLVQIKRKYLGQMDVNAKSQKVWDFYIEVLDQLKNYGCKILRLDAFAYLHKEVGQSNFFNKPGTWDYLGKLNQKAHDNNLVLLPEIHSEYGLHLHDEVASKGYMIYDFFLPGLILHTIEKASNIALLKWANEILNKGFKVVNMLGCHDGIPLLDLKGKEVNGTYQEGLLSDEEIDDLMNLVLSRGGRVKNLYGADGKKISYYQVNATYFSALGEDENKMLLARAIQLFMPGTPQIWYLDLFLGKNDHEAVEKAGPDGHKEINRTTLTTDQVENGLKNQSVLKQLNMIRLRNTHKAFDGNLSITAQDSVNFVLSYNYEDEYARLIVDLSNKKYVIEHS